MARAPRRRVFILLSLASAACAAAAAAACSDAEPAVTPAPVTEAGTDTTPPPPPPIVEASVDALPPNPMPGCTQDPGVTPSIVFDPAQITDPTGGPTKFTIEKALEGFASGTGVLTALLTTELGTIRCSLDETNAPISVANFVGLARGVRPFDKEGKWAIGRFYDGLVFHRVIPGFVIQGGDPNGDGTGGPGYDLVPENQVDEPLGTLAMASGRAPSGSQFYVVVGRGPAPDYNVFGTCTVETAIAIANVPRDLVDHPTTEVHIQRVDIGRCPDKVVVDGGAADAGDDADAGEDAGQ